MSEQTTSESKQIVGLTVGRMVHYVMPNGVHRPAIVVHVWDKDSGLVNVRVLTDGANDTAAVGWHPDHPDWVTSIQYDDSPDPAQHTWHWIERA